MIKTYPEYSSKLMTPDAIRNYILGNKGVVTLKSPTGVHHTYLFSKPRNEDQFPEDVRFVYALHDNNKLFYVGKIERNRFSLTKSSRFLWGNDIVKGAIYILRMANSLQLNTKMELYHEGICCRCGRPLTNPKSIETGIGPKCRKLLYGSR